MITVSTPEQKTMRTTIEAEDKDGERDDDGGGGDEERGRKLQGKYSKRGVWPCQ